MSKYTKEEILKSAQENGVEFIRLQFTDVFGIMKNVAITSSQLEKALDNECMFDGSSIDGFVRINESDMYLHPDYDTWTIFPWRKHQNAQTARLICSVYCADNKTPFLGDPRNVLQKVMNEAAEMGYSFNVGPECEFFLFKLDEDGNPTTTTGDEGGYFDLNPIDHGENCRRDICLALEEMGYTIEASHHEVAEGQHEIDFKFDEVMTSADRVMTFKHVVKTYATKHGLHATFMPKPIYGINGSGMHTNMSLMTKNAEGKTVNAFYDSESEDGLSDVAHYFIGELRIEDAGKEVTLFGWCQRQRDLGNLIFIDLRDRTGLVQLSFNDTTDREVFAKAQSVRAEYVVAAVGTVCERESKTNKIATGDIEINVKEFRIISKAETPPFEIAKSEKVGDETTLKYRYLNLRNEKLTQNILMRHKIAKIAREYFYDNDFIEIETPMMIKSTPEGARDYVVPSRVHNGKFYALPQSPQIYKQLCMIAGFDRYIQLARCFRDEDLRADRQPEFTQIDLEMSFVDTDDIMEMAEGFIKKLMKETIDVDIDFPLPRMTFAEAQEKYGSDKPDTRFGMLIEDITAWAEKTDFVSGDGCLSPIHIFLAVTQRD